MRWQFRPLGTWQGASTPPASRKASPFKARYEVTLDLLFAEVEHLRGQNLVIQVDVAEDQIRTDGLPYARARFGSHPGVIISFDSMYGPLRYATDTFTSWQANLRAIALSLEALRRVDRYGVTKRGEQYTGWKAIEQPRAGHFDDAAAAERWMRGYAADSLGLSHADSTDLPLLYRRMARMMHPDTGHPRADWDRLDEAKRLLTEAGRMP